MSPFDLERKETVTDAPPPSDKKTKSGNAKSAGSKDGRSDKESMRSKVGWIALALCALIVYGVLRYKSTGEVGFFELNRTCIIMILLWLAWPELEALPRWLLYAVPICVGVCAWRPQYIVVVLPLTFLYLLLRPPARKKTKKKK